jgi:hypothetical protein
VRVLQDRQPLALGELGKLAEHDPDVLVFVGIELEVDRRANGVDQDERRVRLEHVPVELGKVGGET